MFDYPVIAGNPETALKGVSSIAISRKMAALFFKDPEDTLGKSIRYENRLDFIISAVFENVSPKSSLKFDFLINWESQISGRLEWSSNVVLTTIQLAKNANVSEVEKKITDFLKLRLAKNEPVKIEIGLQPFGDRYLVSNFVHGKPQGGRIEYVTIFTGVAFLILIIACINFMNLATAQSVKRAREVGVRKILGSSRSDLIRQFLGESILPALFVLIFSIILVQLFVPYFNKFTGKVIGPPYSNASYWLILLEMMLITGIIAGSYPALFLSSLKPVRLLKGLKRFKGSAIWLRKSLSFFQFSLSILLLIATLVVSKLSRAFAGLTITISCLGLLGLAIFSAEQRIKEIGIRKVL